jgi:hypothetical protein
LSSEVLDKTHVEMLRKSAMTVGYLKEIIYNAENPNDLLSGKHRVAADPNWPSRTQKVESPLHRELIIVHDNVQREVPEETTRYRLLRIARLLSTTGGIVNGRMVEPVKQEDVCERLTDTEWPLVPFSPQHVRRCLPDEYKHMEHSVREKPSSENTGSQILEKELSKKQKDLLRPFTQKEKSVEELTTEALDNEVPIYPKEGCKCPTCGNHIYCYGCPVKI